MGNGAIQSSNQGVRVLEAILEAIKGSEYLKFNNQAIKYSDPLIFLVFAGCCAPLLGVGHSRRYVLNLCIGAWTRTPLRFSGAFTRFFPENVGLT